MTSIFIKQMHFFIYIYDRIILSTQALPMTTVAVGSLNELQVCRVETDSKGADEPRYVEYDTSLIQQGSPKWANYVKGDTACFHGISLIN